MPSPTPTERLAEIRAEIAELRREEQDIYRASISEADANLKVCPDDLAESLAEDPLTPEPEFPFEVHGVAWSRGRLSRVYLDGAAFGSRTAVGAPVSIRPVTQPGDEPQTHLGFFLGSIATSAALAFSKDGIVEVTPSRHNPAIWVPELNRVVFGMESWWAEIDSVEALREITDDDIANIWYVQAAKMLAGDAGEEDSNG